jgi:hypothetical protein
MIPECNDYGVYINDLMAVRLYRSDGRPRSSGNGYAMWSYNYRPLGWVDDGSYLVECVTACLLVGGQLTPRWEHVPTGIRLIHPRYTLTVEQTSNGWVPSISDELIGRSHSFKARKTSIEAGKLLNDLLRRRVGREKPAFEPQRWLDPSDQVSQKPEFRLGLRVIGPDIAALIHNAGTKNHWADQRLASALELAKLLDRSIRYGFDELPRLATILATYIKFALIDIYRGNNSVVLDPAACPLTFATKELVAFRDRFRRSPITDEEYLDFVSKHFISPLEGLRRKHRVPKSSIVGLRLLHPVRDRGDFPIEWPCQPGTRLFEVTALDTVQPFGGTNVVAN